MASCPTPPRPRRSDSINHIVSMGPMNVPALKLCDADEAAEGLGFRFVLDPPPNIPCKRGNDDDDGKNDEASSSFVPIERDHRSSLSDPILKIRPRPSRARAFAASSTASTSTAHSSINMNVGITFTPIDDDDDEEEEVKLTSSPPRAKPKSAAANIITPTKAMMTRSIMKKSYKLAVRNSNSSSRRKEVRSTVNKNAAAPTATTTPHPSCSSPAAA